MIVDLQSISRNPRHFNLTFQPEWWRQNGDDVQVQGLKGPLTVTAVVSREDERFVINGRLKGKLRLACDRCLESYTFSLHRDFRLALAPPEQLQSAQDETELKEEDLAVEFIAAGKIDLDDVIREQVYLSLPMKLLCRNSCEGLCSNCGVNLNSETCKCSKGGGHPAFQKLKDLKIR